MNDKEMLSFPCQDIKFVNYSWRTMQKKQNSKATTFWIFDSRIFVIFVKYSLFQQYFF